MIIYLDTQKAIELHDLVLSGEFLGLQSGGLPGIKIAGNLESPLHHIQNDDYYPTFTDKLTHLIFCLNKFHAFEDGNKRSSLAVGGFFLELNGYDYCIDVFFRKMENICVWVADNKIEKELLKEIVESIIFEDDFSESLKIKIFNSLFKN